MRLFKTMILLAVMATGNAALAQSEEDIMQMSMADLETDRQAIVTAGMGLSDADAEKFWPVYKSYRAEVEGFKQRTLNLIKAYAENYGSLTNEQAAALIKDYMELDADRSKARNKYVKKMQKELNPVLAMRFLQIENKLDAIVSFGLAAQIPLAE